MSSIIEYVHIGGWDIKAVLKYVCSGNAHLIYVYSYPEFFPMLNQQALAWVYQFSTHGKDQEFYTWQGPRIETITPIGGR